jgi:hypothetical protein
MGGNTGVQSVTQGGGSLAALKAIQAPPRDKASVKSSANPYSVGYGDARHESKVHLPRPLDPISSRRRELDPFSSALLANVTCTDLSKQQAALAISQVVAGFTPTFDKAAELKANLQSLSLAVDALQFPAEDLDASVFVDNLNRVSSQLISQWTGFIGNFDGTSSPLNPLDITRLFIVDTMRGGGPTSLLGISQTIRTANLAMITSTISAQKAAHPGNDADYDSIQGQLTDSVTTVFNSLDTSIQSASTNLLTIIGQFVNVAKLGVAQKRAAATAVDAANFQADVSQFNADRHVSKAAVQQEVAATLAGVDPLQAAAHALQLAVGASADEFSAVLDGVCDDLSKSEALCLRLLDQAQSADAGELPEQKSEAKAKTAENAAWLFPALAGTSVLIGLIYFIREVRASRHDTLRGALEDAAIKFPFPNPSTTVRNPLETFLRVLVLRDAEQNVAEHHDRLRILLARVVDAGPGADRGVVRIPAWQQQSTAEQ